ncbi:MAG: hypothetical protein C0481_03675 [Phenylobacterium sp.]|uniref:hypothetical protein n=1 Tax=Phenylobacterium sp. TaxID=1871053 RepID=UPI0025F5480B|nr:hypothetical protein [Phenylobacterium sp.]MBA4010942.1 hypothetical protein [Phenylobacterium sp.]
MRRFRVYAFDPLASMATESASFNHAVIALPWEEPWEEPLSPGPSGEYLEVVDFDPASGRFYAPLDPLDPVLLAQDGLPPSEGRPQFHQQMVYAVAMRTIRNFERAMGRKVLWSPNWDQTRLGRPVPIYVQKLRLYPHAFRHNNAYYSPQKKAVLFGYFQAKSKEGSRSLPGAWVFAALSHDIIAHEITHAILDGTHTRFIERSSPDAPAFHEAFADVVALLQHFTMREVVAAHLARSRGVLRLRSLLTGLARQFNDARGRAGAMREGVDGTDESASPVVGAYAGEREAHARGAHLVAAVFDGFLTIFEQRSADLLRLAGGSPGTELHPDLIARLAKEATKVADQMLRICVRALDYMPPVDPRFGEFLRAMITADADLVPDDPMHYRVAIAAAFRRRGILPDGTASMAPDSLKWESPEDIDAREGRCRFDESVELDIQPKFERYEIWRQAQVNRMRVQAWLDVPSPLDPMWERRMGVALTGATWARNLQTIPLGPDRLPKLDVHSVRLARRAGPDGQDLRQIIIEVTQDRRAFFDPAEQEAADRGAQGARADQDFWFRGGCTMVVDPRDWSIRYVVRKRIDDNRRLAQQRDYMLDRDVPPASRVGLESDEPFAFLHEV